MSSQLSAISSQLSAHPSQPNSCDLLRLLTRFSNTALNPVKKPAAALQIAHVLGQLFTGLQPYIGFLPVRTEARVLAAAAFFAKHIRRAYRGHLDFEQRLNCLL